MRLPPRRLPVPGFPYDTQIPLGFFPGPPCFGPPGSIPNFPVTATNPNFRQQIMEDLKGKVMANLASSPRPNPKNTPNPPGLPKPLAVEVLKAQQERLKKELGKDKPEPKKIEPEKPKNLGSVLKEQVLRQDPQLEKIPNSTETGILKAQELVKPTNKLKEQLNGLRLELKKENPAMPPPGLSPKTDEAHPKIADPASLGREREVPRREAAQRGPERLDHDVVPQSLEIRVLEPTQRAPERRLQDVQSRARGEGVQEPVRHYPERLEHDVVPESLETWGPEPTQHYSEHRDRRESNSTQSSIPAPPGFEHAVARRQNRDEVRDVRRRDSESSAGPPGLIYQQRKQEDEGYFESRHTSADSLPQPQPVYDTKAIWVHRLPGNYDTQAVAERLRIREDEIVFDHTEPQIVLRYDPYDDRISALIYFLHQNVAKEFHAGWHNQMLDGKILETAYRKC